jgi:hypothetical protein
MFAFKSLKIQKNTAKITLSLSSETGVSEGSETFEDNQLKALSILLGAYNIYGRKIELEKHRSNIIKFYDIINEIAETIT